MDISKYLTVGMRDFIKGAVMAALTASLTMLYQILQAGGTPTLDQLKASALVGVGAAIAYIIKNFFTNNKGQMLTKDAPPPQPEIPGGKG